MSDHFRRLERMYLAEPVNERYTPALEVSEGAAADAAPPAATG